MSEKAAERLDRLSRHLTCSDATITNIQSPTTSLAKNETKATHSNAENWHKECYNYDPGRLLLDQVAIVTGAGSGIGRSTAILFAHHGAYVTVSDINAAAAEATASFIRNSAGDRCIVVAGDVTAEDFPNTIIKKTIDAFGRLDILVPNAGFTWDGVIQKMSTKQFQTMLNVHLTSVWHLIKSATPFMRDVAKKELSTNGRAHPRSIVFVSSISGVHGLPGQTNYSAAKAGVIGLCKALAKEWGGYNIRCNAIAPGFISTRLTQSKGKGNFVEVDGERVELGIPDAQGLAQYRKAVIPLGRDGQPEEAAGAILMLACPYSSYITGQVLEVEGGMNM